MIISSFHPVLGGAEVVTERLSSELVKQGVSLVLLTRRYPGLSRAATVSNIPVHRLGHPSRTRVGSASFAVHAFWILATRLSEYDLVHVHNTDTPLLVGFVAKLLLGRRLFVTIHGDPVPLLGPARWTGPTRLRLMKRLADAIGVLSAEMQERLVRMGVPQSCIRVLPNGVNTTLFCPPTAADRRRARSELRLDEDLLVYLFVGRLWSSKGIGILLEAWARLTPGVRRKLIIVGEGPELNALERIALELRAANVSFVPRTRDVLRYLHAAEVFVLPSRTEGLSSALLEAMATGLAVVVSDIPGNQTLVRHGETGLTFPVDDIGALQRQLAALDSSDLRRRLGRNAHESIQDYTTAAIAQVHRRMYGV